MPKGKESRKRINKQNKAVKVAARKAEKQTARTAMAATPQLQSPALTIPTVTEDDLLSFQFAHFGDDTRPDTFFVDPETALNYNPGLGCYEDGVERTLTDEDIQLLRHAELQTLMRLRRHEIDDIASEKEDGQTDDDDDDDYEPTLPSEKPSNPASPPRSPVSDASSLEGELLTNKTRKKIWKPDPKPKRHSTHRRRSGSARSGTPLSPRSRKRKEEIPYDQRNKRKWENYVEGSNAAHEAVTHNRLARELDEQRHEDVAMDYGDDEPVAPKTRQPAAMPGRRMISYDDD